MNKAVRVLIADDNRDLVEVIRAYIQNQEDMEVIGVAYNGNEALNLIYQESPDLVVLDMIMPLLDGLGVLEKLQFEEKRPRVIVLSAFFQESIAQKAIRLGTDYFMLKPIDLDILARRIRQLCKSKTSIGSLEPNAITHLVNDIPEVFARNWESEVTIILYQLGVPSHVKGYQYLREAIISVVQKVSLLDAVTRELYPKVAVKYKTTPSRVEQGIRHAIELAWKRGNIQLKKEFFGYNIDSRQGGPTNLEFIALVVDNLRISRRF